MEFDGKFRLHFYYMDSYKPLRISVEVKGFKEVRENFLDLSFGKVIEIDIVRSNQK